MQWSPRLIILSVKISTGTYERHYDGYITAFSRNTVQWVLIEMWSA
jgi:hypothetical protein